jgi:hypothetical protein
MTAKMIAFPTADEIRTALIERAKLYAELTGMSLAAVGLAAVNDGAFIQDCEHNDRNFQIKSYGRLMGYLDDNWPKSDSTKRSRERKSA